jgi:hypothetical protein
MKFYMVCAWDQYYPLGGINNIKAVFDNLLSAEEYMTKLQDVPEADRWKLRDYYEIFSSDQLPWRTEE